MAWSCPVDNEVFLRCPDTFPEIWDKIFLPLSIGERKSAQQALPEWGNYIDQERFSRKTFQFQWEKRVRESDPIKPKTNKGQDPKAPPKS